MESNLSHTWRSVIDDASRYAKLQVEYAKLKAGEKTVKVGARLSTYVLVFFLFVFVIMMAVMAGGFWISQLLESYALGFLVMGGVLTVISVIILIFKKHLLIKPMTSLIVRSLYDNDENDENDEDND